MSMTKNEFRRWVKGLIKESQEGYYGTDEVIDEIWDWVQFSYVLPIKNSNKK